MLFCIKIVVQLAAASLLLKLELFLSEIRKTLRLKVAAKTLMNLSSTLIKVDYNREMFSHQSVRRSCR